MRQKREEKCREDEEEEEEETKGMRMRYPSTRFEETFFFLSNEIAKRI